MSFSKHALQESLLPSGAFYKALENALSYEENNKSKTMNLLVDSAVVLFQSIKGEIDSVFSTNLYSSIVDVALYTF